jgi:hypothetical protein
MVTKFIRLNLGECGVIFAYDDDFHRYVHEGGYFKYSSRNLHAA